MVAKSQVQAIRPKRSSFHFLLYLVSVMVFILVLSACSNNGSTNEVNSELPVASNAASEDKEMPASKEIVELKAFFPGDTPAGFQDVLAAVNTKLATDNIGAKLNIQFISWDDYANKTTIMASAGDQFDMFLDAPWMHISQMINSDSIIPLDDYVKNTPNLQQSIPQQMWDANKFNGQIYGIPLGVVQGNIQGFLIRKDLREKYGMPVITTLDELEKFLYTVKEKEKDILPFGMDSAKTDLLETYFNPTHYEQNVDYYPIGVNLFYGTKDGKINPIYLAPGFKETQEKLTKYYKDGIFEKNIMNQKNTQAIFNQGKIAAVQWGSDGTSAMGYLDALKISGVQLEVVAPYVGDAKPNSDYKQWNFLVVPKNSKHPDLVMNVMDWLSIPENHDLLEYGVKGTDWEEKGDLIHPISNYAFPGFVMTWRPTLERALDTMLPDDKLWYDYAKDANHFNLSPFTGFTANTEAVKTEIAKINPYFDQTLKPMNAGVLTADKGIPMLMDQMDKAGSQKVIDEIQKQFDAFKSK
jgi:putative aldouronate transport system substrate-binding protein